MSDWKFRGPIAVPSEFIQHIGAAVDPPEKLNPEVLENIAVHVTQALLCWGGLFS
jgi:hypothetical protein